MTNDPLRGKVHLLDSFRVYSRKQFELAFLSLTILLYIFKMAMPVLKYPFLGLFAGFCAYSFFVSKSEIWLSVKSLVREYRIILIVILYLVISFFFSYKIYFEVFKDIINVGIILIFFILLQVFINTRAEIDEFLNYVNNHILLFACLTSLYALIHIFVISTFSNVINPTISQIFKTDINNTDYNFALLPSFFGIFYIFSKLKSERKLGKIVFCNLLLFLFSLNIFFAGSRRGFILFIIILSGIVIIQILGYFQKKRHQYYGFNTSYYFSFIFLIVGFILFFISFAPYHFKNSVLLSIGTKDIVSAKENIASKIYRSFKILTKESDYIDFYNSIWTDMYMPEDPESGWGRRVHKTIYPLTGNNVSIVPPMVKGYQMDNSCNADTWNGNAYSFTQLKYTRTNPDDIVYASVYCYVTNDFDGEWAKIVLEGSILGTPYGKNLYDLSHKGEWQKLETVAYAKNGIVIPSLYFSKFGVTDFSSLKGDVIFAYPQVKYISNRDSIEEIIAKDPANGWARRNYTLVDSLNTNLLPPGTKGYLMDHSCNADTWNGNAYSYTQYRHRFADENDIVKAEVYCYVSEDFDGEWVRLLVEGSVKNSVQKSNEYNLSRKGIWQKLTFETECSKGIVIPTLYFSKYNTKDFSGLKGYVIFALPTLKVINSSGNKPVSGLLIIDGDMKSSAIKTNVLNASLLPISKIETLITNTPVDPDPVRKFLANVLKEDTSYMAFKSVLSVDQNINDFTGSRIARWKLALQIFQNEYSFSEKLIGGGFAFLNWYGHIFYNDKNRTDYPHNPFLYILLYSGILGLLIYLYLMILSIAYYIKYLRNYFLFFLYFLITYFFVFFSSGSPFDPPVMGFLCILPFFINSIFKKAALTN